MKNLPNYAVLYQYQNLSFDSSELVSYFSLLALFNPAFVRGLEVFCYIAIVQANLVRNYDHCFFIFLCFITALCNEDPGG